MIAIPGAWEWTIKEHPHSRTLSNPKPAQPYQPCLAHPFAETTIEAQAVLSRYSCFPNDLGASPGGPAQYSIPFPLGNCNKLFFQSQLSLSVIFLYLIKTNPRDILGHSHNHKQ